MTTVPSEEPPTMSAPSYGSMDVNSIRIHGPITQDNQGATKQYVDTATLAVRDGILGDGVSGALDKGNRRLFE